MAEGSLDLAADKDWIENSLSFDLSSCAVGSAMKVKSALLLPKACSLLANSTQR